MDLSTEELFDRYNEETDILSNDKSVAVILYGSRTTNSYKPTSDLDVFVVVPDNKKSHGRSQRFIDGVLVETFEVTTNTLGRLLYDDIMDHNTFYESVFKNGIVKKDNSNIVDGVLKFIKQYKNTEQEVKVVDGKITFVNKKRTQNSMKKLDPEWISQLDEYLYLYHSSNGGEKTYHYYEFIEYLRTVYLHMNDLPETVDSITYDLYTDENKAERYLVELPSSDFIDCFIKAMRPTDMNESIKELSSFIGYKDYRQENRNVEIQEKHQKCSLFEDTRDIFINLLYLAKDVDKLETKLIKNAYDTDYYYYNFLHFSYRKYIDSPYVDESLFKDKFKLALEAFDMDSRINAVEEIFHVFNKDKNFDYCDYSL